jgi:hypothetical protein
MKNMDNANSGSVSGVLLYAKTDEKVVPDNEYMMGGSRICKVTRREISIIRMQSLPIIKHLDVFPSKLGEKNTSPRKGTGYHPNFVEYQRTGQHEP